MGVDINGFILGDDDLWTRLVFFVAVCVGHVRFKIFFLINKQTAF